MKAVSQFTISEINDGAQGAQGVSVTSEQKQYRLSNSSTELTGSGEGYTWSTTMPQVSANTYLWIRTATTLSDNSTIYSNATCDVTISGVVSTVDNVQQSITNKVWSSDISSSINAYDTNNGTETSIRDRVSQTETDISGITSRVSDVETTTTSLGTRMTTAESSITQNANNISSKVSKDSIISEINQSAESVTIQASKVDLIGNVTFSMLDTAAQNRITTAESTASTASQNASAAVSTANAASQDASDALSTANTADQNASSAVTTANTANTNASTALSTANTANTNASTALSTANTANTNASTALSTANTANTNATHAKDIIDNWATDATSTTTTIKGGLIQTHTILSDALSTDAIMSSNYAGPEVTVSSGAFVTYEDGVDEMPVKSCVLDIEPVQSGTGNPSPDNVRPISGWTGVKVYRSGKNLCDTTDMENGFYNNEGVFYGGDGYRTTKLLPVKSGTTYVSSIFDENGSRVNNLVATLWDRSGNIIRQVTSSTFTVENGEEYVRLRNFQAQTTLIQEVGDNVKYQLELGTVPTTYEEYQGNVYSITFPSEAGTVYGGTLDVTNGLLTVDKAVITITNADSYVRNNANNYYIKASAIPGIKKPSVGEASIMSDRFISFLGANTKGVCFLNPGGYIRFNVLGDGYDTVSDMLAAIGYPQFVYPLETPLTYTLTPTEIQSIQGYNIMYTDVGDITVGFQNAYGDDVYSQNGTYLDLYSGSLTTPHFVVDNVTGNAYFKGEVVADSGSIGGWQLTDKQIYTSVKVGNKDYFVFLRKYDDSAILATTSGYNLSVNYNQDGEFELTPTQDGYGSFSFTYNLTDHPTKILYIRDSYSTDRDTRVNLTFYQNGEYSTIAGDPVTVKVKTGEQTVNMASRSNAGGSITITISYNNMAVSDGTYKVKLKITNFDDVEYTIASGSSITEASLDITAIGVGQKTATGVISYPFFVNRRGELYAYNAHIAGEVTATSGSFTGAVNATSGSFTGTVNATNGSFNGAITAQSGNIGGYTIVQSDTAGTTETTANDGHVYPTGLYVHSSDGTYEYETGIRGSSTDDEDEAFYVRRIAQDGTWDSSTPTFYVKNNGYLYANNANITGAITATSGSFTGNITAQGGTIGGFNITKSDGGCAAKTSANGGHAYPTSLYVHNSDNTYEYETGIKGESSTGTLAFYVTRITKGGNWQIPSNGGTRTDVFKIEHGGKLYCTNADITGKVTATSFSAQYNGNSSNVLATLTATYLSVANSSYSTLIGASGVTANVLSSGGGSVYTRFCRLTANLGFETYNNSAWGSFYGNSVDVAYDGVRQGRFTASAAGNIGLYDVDNSNYVIYSASDFVVHIPHPTVLTSVQTYDGYYKPVGSYGTDGRRVAYISARVDGSNYQFRVAGQWGTTGSTYSTKTIWSASTSDIRLKENIEPTRINGLDAVNRMLVRQFDWKNTGIHQKIGFVADELESIDSNLALGGGYDEDGNMDEKQVNTYQLVAYLTKAVQELSAKVDTLETQIKELKGDK